MRQVVGLCLVGAGMLLYSCIAVSQERIEPALEHEPVAESGQDASAEHREGEPAEEETETGQIASALKAIETAVRELVAQEDAEERERQIQREIADLHAQQDMARWAEGMIWATWAGVAVTFVGVALIAWTLHHTRRAADAAFQMVDEAKKTTGEAARAANAAIDANALTRRAFVSEQRAWLNLDVEIASSLTWDGNTGLIRIRFKSRNFGRTPAPEVFIHATLLLVNGILAYMKR